MELLRDAEPVIRESLPLVFDEAGLPSHSKTLRGTGGPWTLKDALEAAEALRNIHSGLESCECPESPGLREVLQDCAFWAEGMILSAIEGDIDLFDQSMIMLERSLREFPAELTEH